MGKEKWSEAGRWEVKLSVKALESKLVTGNSAFQHRLNVTLSLFIHHFEERFGKKKRKEKPREVGLGLKAIRSVAILHTLDRPRLKKIC